MSLGELNRLCGYILGILFVRRKKYISQKLRQYDFGVKEWQRGQNSSKTSSKQTFITNCRGTIVRGVNVLILSN